RMLISLSWRWGFRHAGRGDRAPTHLWKDAVPASCFPKPVFFATEQVNPFLRNEASLRWLF
ncbi:MAG: hypothetical protein K6U12_10560, partial [Armatimonadetes bacterium]|nr:hypothetical protein [Armatimonadota bacterium]